MATVSGPLRALPSTFDRYGKTVTFRWDSWKAEALDRYVEQLQRAGWDVSRSSLCAQALDEFMAGRWGSPALVVAGEAKEEPGKAS